MLRADVLTISDWMRAATAGLAEAGYASPRHEAEHLIAHEFGLRWSDLWSRLRDPIEPSQAMRLDTSLARRCSGEPLAYITGSVIFYGLELECGPGVLVPRPETETLVDVALQLVAGDRPVVVDIGTGTGAVAIALAVVRPGAEVWATDVSGTALAYARRNATRSAVGVNLVCGDLFAPLPASLHGRIDLVVSNPPYVAWDVELPADVMAEPREALRAGPRGDEVLRRIVRDADVWLSPNGAVALEVGTAEQASVLAHALSELGTARVVNDQTGRPRVVWARR